jgi:hypothetical protein
MTAAVPTDTSKLTGLVTDIRTNGNDRRYIVIVIEDSAAGSAETYAVTNVDASITGIVGPMCETWKALVTSTASTWSSTTITYPTTAETAYKGVWLCYS